MKYKKRQKVKSSQSASNSKDGELHRHRPLIKEDNPMRIDLILEILFSYCPTDTLLNCRLVCRQWRDISLKSWRQKCTLCLHKEWNPSITSHLNVKNYLLYHTSVDKNKSLVPLNLRRFVDSHKPPKLQQHPFRNFRIDSSTLGYLEPDVNVKSITGIARHVTLHEVKKGYRNFGPFLYKLRSLESLEIRNCDWGWKFVPALIVSQKLKRLKICQNGIQKPGCYFPRKKFFEHFLNMEALSLDYRMAKSSMDEIKNILEIKKSIKRTKYGNGSMIPMKLKELEVINVSPSGGSNFWRQHFDEDFIETIVDCDFPLETLKLDLGFSGKMKIKKAMRSLGRLLHSSSESLQNLRTSFYFDMDVFIDRVIDVGHCKNEKVMRMKLRKALKPVRRMNIVMGSLKTLEVSNGLWGLYLLAHLRLPNLEKLTVEYGKQERKVNILDYQVKLLKGKKFPKLERFELLENHDIPGPETVAVFSDMMPNLSALSCPLDKEGFIVVCQRFKGLKTLNILGAQCHYAVVDDEALTGVKVKKGGRRQRQRRPNITDLTDLTDLSISRHGDVAVFTDHSVVNGFLKLSRLYSLNVAIKEISEKQE